VILTIYNHSHQNKVKQSQRLTLMALQEGTYSQTCIKRTPSIKQTAVQVPFFFSYSH